MFKPSKKLIIWTVIILVVVVGIIVAVAAKPKVAYETEAVDRGPVVEAVSVTGSIAPLTKIQLQPEVAAKIVKIPVKEGDSVKAGDLLIKLDSRDIEARVAAQRAALVGADALYRELQAGATTEDLRLSETAVKTSEAQLAASVSAKADAETALVNAHQNLDNTRAKVDTLIVGKVSTFLSDYDEAVTVAGDAVNRLTSPMFSSSDFLTFTSSDAQAETNAINTRKEAKVSLPLVSAAVTQARAGGDAVAVQAAYLAVSSNLSAVKRHVDAAAVVLSYAVNLSSTTLATYQQNVNLAQSYVDSVIEKLAADQNGLELQQRLNDVDVTNAEISHANAEAALTGATHAIETAQSSLDQARAAYQMKKTGARPEQVDAQRAQVAAQRAALDGLLADLSKRSILAPLDGIVTTVDAEIGENVQPGKPLVLLNAQDHFEIIANISEVDIANIRVGEPVKITLDAFSSDELWAGTVTSVNPAEKVVEGVIFYETKILFDQEDPRLKSGMTANLDIEVARKDDVLRLPIRGLREKTGRTYVEILRAGKSVEVDIKIGIENTEHVEILSGLGEGEAVIVGTK